MKASMCFGVGVCIGAMALTCGAQTATPPVKIRQIQAPQQEPVQTTVKDNALMFEVKDLDGKTITHESRELQGKVVLVDIWGTWCPPCRAAIPTLVKLYDEYHESGLEIIGVAFENADTPEERVATVKKFAEENGIKYTLAEGGKRERGTVEKALTTVEHFRGYPTMVIIGRDGKVRDVHVGFGGEKTANELHEIVTELIAEPAPRPQRGQGGQLDPAQVAQRMIERFDGNDDGKLSKDELPERLQAMFDDADANKDGFLDAKELGALGIGRRGGQGAGGGQRRGGGGGGTGGGGGGGGG